MSTRRIYLNGNVEYDDEAGTVTFIGVPQMPEGYPDPMGWWQNPESSRPVRVVIPASSFTIGDPLFEPPPA